MEIATLDMAGSKLTFGFRSKIGSKFTFGYRSKKKGSKSRFEHFVNGR